MELALCHLSGTWNFEVACRFLESLWTIGLLNCLEVFWCGRILADEIINFEAIFSVWNYAKRVIKTRTRRVNSELRLLLESLLAPFIMMVIYWSSFVPELIAFWKVVFRFPERQVICLLRNFRKDHFGSLDILYIGYRWVFPRW